MIRIEETVDHGRISSEPAALRPILEALIEEHGLLLVADEMAGAAGMRNVTAAYVRLCGWDYLVAAVAEARPTHPHAHMQSSEPF